MAPRRSPQLSIAKLGGPGQPNDAREKFQYTLVALQNAIRTAQGKACVAPAPIDGPTDKDWAEA